MNEIERIKNGELAIVYTAARYAASYNEAVDRVARERKYLSTVTGFPLDGSKWFVENAISHNAAQYFLVDGDRVAGWCDIIPNEIPEFSHVGTLGMGLLPEYRGSGWGRKLLDRTIAHARDVNALEKVELAVFSSNAIAIRLYESADFAREGTKKRVRKIDGGYDDEILMARFLL